MYGGLLATTAAAVHYGPKVYKWAKGKYDEKYNKNSSKENPPKDDSSKQSRNCCEDDSKRKFIIDSL